MNTIKITIDYPKEITLNGEYKTAAPVVVTWFPNIDLVIQTEFEKIVFNSANDAVITPQSPNPELTDIKDVSLKLVQNNLAKYIIINDKYAYKLPNSNFDIV